MARNISGTFPDRASAERAASDLRTAGFPPAEIGLVAQTRTGPTDTGQRLAPGTRTITAAIIGSLIVGTIGWILGWAFIHLLPSISHTGGPALAAEIVVSCAGGILGWLWGALLINRAPVEEAYYRERQMEAGTMRLVVDAGERGDEALRILRRNGARDIGEGGRARPSRSGAGPTQGATA